MNRAENKGTRTDDRLTAALERQLAEARLDWRNPRSVPTRLMQRTKGDWPLFLHLCNQEFRSAGEQQARAGETLLAAQLLQTRESLLPLANGLSLADRARRVAELAQAAWAGTEALGQPRTLAEHLLQRALLDQSDRPLPVANDSQVCRLLHGASQVTMPFLLVDGQDEGRMAELRLWLFWHTLEAEPWEFVPAPHSFLLLDDAKGQFGNALRHARRAVLSRLDPREHDALRRLGNERGIRKPAFAWDLQPYKDDQALQVVGGGSGGAALALGALFLAREFMPAALRNDLAMLTAWDRTLVSAELDQDTQTLIRVDLDSKLKAVGNMAKEWHPAARVYVAPKPPTVPVDVRNVEPSPHETLDELISQLAEDLGAGLTPDQRLLRTLLVQGEPTSPLPEYLPETGESVQHLLARVAQAEGHGLPSSAPGYLVWSYARWYGENSGQRFAQPEHLGKLFVNLELDDDDKAGKRHHPLGYSSLEDLLRQRPGEKGAVLIRAEPGAGKSTVAAFYQMVRARQALHDMFHARPVAELPIYLRLRECPEDAGEADENWAGAWVAAQWASTLAPGAGTSLEDVQRYYPVRFLLDGCNELVQRAEGQRDAALGQMQAWLAQARQQHPRLLAPVFTTRSLDDTYHWRNDRLPVQRATMRRWTVEQIAQYCRRRLDAGLATKLVTLIQEQAEWVEFFGLPLNLSQLCELVGHLDAMRDELGAKLLLGLADRSRLHTAMGWLRLQLAFDKQTALFKDFAWLLSADERRVLTGSRNDWPHRILHASSDGALVQALKRLALHLQKQAGRTLGRALDDDLQPLNVTDRRGQVWPVPAHAWRDAALATGLLRRNARQPDEFEFEHHLIQEYWAARALGSASTEAWPDVRAPALDPPSEEALVSMLPKLESLPAPPVLAWEETIAFAAQMDRQPWHLISHLMREGNLALAGRAARACLVRLQQDKTGREVLANLKQALLDGSTNPARKPAVDIRQRIEWAEALGWLGDDDIRYSRVVCRDGHSALLPRSPLWIPVEGGDYQVGVEGVQRQHEDEGPLVRVSLQPFEMAYAPLTNAEFEYFIRAGGYQQVDLWQGSRARAWLARCDPEREPMSRGGNPLQPVNVTLYEAKAYANWLTRLCDSGDATAVYSVPTEAQLAVVLQCWPGHNPVRQWPCEGLPGPLLFNHAATFLGGTSPVGVFSGSQIGGFVDLFGQVFEWTLSQYTPEGLLDQELCSEGNDDVDRAVRGGNWTEEAEPGCRAAFRNLRHPEKVTFGTGLRLVRFHAAPHV